MVATPLFNLPLLLKSKVEAVALARPPKIRLHCRLCDIQLMYVSSLERAFKVIVFHLGGNEREGMC